MAVNAPYKKSTATTTNHTANYDLPLWAGEDTTSWLTQMNDAMNKIDDGMVDAKSKALEVVSIAADAKKLADETKAESAASAKIVAGYNDRLTAAEEKIAEHTQDITNLNTRSDQFDVELHSVQEVQKKTTADLATLAAKVDTNKSDADAKIDGIKAKDTEQDGQISTINTEVSSLDSRVTALEGVSGGSVTGKVVLKYVKSTTLSSVTDSKGKSHFGGCSLGAYLYSDGTCDFTLSSADTNPFATDTTFDGSIGLFDLSAGVREIMEEFKKDYPNIAIVRPMPQHAYPIIFYETNKTPRHVINGTINAIFTATSQEMSVKSSYGLAFSALGSGAEVRIIYAFPSGAYDYRIGSTQNFMIASVQMSGV